MIVIIDSGGANLLSLMSAFSRLNVEVRVSSSRQDIAAASHVILPGVGCAQTIMQRLHALGLVDFLKTLSKPLLGICVGMQILFEFSEEGSCHCLGLLSGRVEKLPAKPNLSLPHMGWNTLRPCGNAKLMQSIGPSPYVYFVHNFAAPVSDDTIATSCYGVTFSAAVQRRHLMGVQFHPERSGSQGAQILKNFLEFFS